MDKLSGINLTRHGKWKVRVDDVIFSSHNEAKEGYESYFLAKIQNPKAVVKLVPEFYIDGEINYSSESFNLTAEFIEANLQQLPNFDEVKEYKYVLFEIDENGIKNFTEPKTVTINTDLSG